MWRDEHTGLYHTHYRLYGPQHVRWLTPDPAGYRDGQNLYRFYAGPNGVDVLGLDEKSIKKLTFEEKDSGATVDVMPSMWVGPLLRKSSYLYTDIRIPNGHDMLYTTIDGALYQAIDTSKLITGTNGEQVVDFENNLERVTDFSGYALYYLEKYASSEVSGNSKVNILGGEFAVAPVDIAFGAAFVHWATHTKEGSVKYKGRYIVKNFS